MAPPPPGTTALKNGNINRVDIGTMKKNSLATALQCFANERRALPPFLQANESVVSLLRNFDPTDAQLPDAPYSFLHSVRSQLPQVAPGAVRLARLFCKLQDVLQSNPELGNTNTRQPGAGHSGCVPKPLSAVLPLPAQAPRRQMLPELAQLVAEVGLSEAIPVVAPADVEVRPRQLFVGMSCCTC